MAVSVVMPALELGQETGMLISWRKKEGERVAKGEPLLEIETDKAVVEIESPAEGILAGVKAREGTEIPVGETIAWIVLPGENVPADSGPAPAAQNAPGQSEAVERALSSTAAGAAPAGSRALRISPKARRLAREHGIELDGACGSGADGEILASDIEALVASGKKAGVALSASQPSSAKLESLSSVQRLMAERTTASWTSVPHFFVVRDADADALLQAREHLNPAIEKSHGLRLTHTDLLIALVARVLSKYPRLNASWTPPGIELHSEVSIGLAVAAKDAVLAGVVRNADTATLGEIAKRRREIAERARAGRLQPADISSATFTISNLGMYRVDRFAAIIVPPQAAILAVGAITNRVVPVEGKPAIRPVMTLTLSCDHRVVDGVGAARFINSIVEAILNPDPWIIPSV
jgi:pyruvate dehydrogenase E2 component (dihydrolipoamide acetyltransferase)